jgi:hypothetical protein
MSTVVDDPTLSAPEPLEAPTSTVTPPAEPPASRPYIQETEEARPLTKEEIVRPALGALSTTLGCAFMVGGMFVGITPRIYAAVGGMVGVASAVWAARATKRVMLVQVLSLAAILLTGLALTMISDLGALGGLSKLIGDAYKEARLHRPPAAFDLGWHAILPWTVGLVGYAAAWVGSLGRKPAVGVLIPIPVIAFAAIAQPAEAQIPAGIVAFVSFAVGLAVIYRADRGEGEGVSTAYELKRAMRTAPIVIVLIAALIGASQLNLLFPEPIFDPTQKAELPRPIPLSAVKDRVLFTVNSAFTGPWRAGVLDVYDGKDFRLPAYSDSSFQDAPASGLLDEVFGVPATGSVRADITIRGLDGTVLPLPSRMNKIAGLDLPTLVTDARSQTLRVKEGQVRDGLAYTAVFALLPTEAELRDAPPPDPLIVTDFTDTAHQPPPPGVAALLAQAPENRWDRLDFVRKKFLDVFTVTGAGLPSHVPPSKVEDMLVGSQEGSPFEFVAAQVLLSRWAGIPARIGYGYDRGVAKAGGVLEFRPKNGSSWLEVYFQGYGWLPITGLPKKALQSVGKSDQQQNADIVPTDDIQVQLFVPLRKIPPGYLWKQIRTVVLLTLPVFLLIGLMYLAWPVYLKSRRRSKRRRWAFEYGREARIALAYTELRDMATDLGVGDPYVTPLAYVRKVVADEEHRELAWLVTRVLWGDLKGNITDDEVFAAEELSRSMRRRLFEAQPFTIRFISIVSRLSLRNPYAPEVLSPPVEKFDPRRALARLFKRKPKVKPVKEKVDEAIEIA